MSTNRKIALVSGGIDSVLVTAEFPEAQPLFVDYGQREVDSELLAVERLWPNTLRLSVPTIVPRGTFFPARNLLLATLAVSCWEADVVLLGGMADDFCADKTPEAFEAMSKILTDQSGRAIVVHSPFWNRTKAEAIADYIAHGRDCQRFMFTFSCYQPVSGKSCGDCPACFRKSCALLANDLPAQLISERMFTEYFRKLHKYPAARQWTIIHAYRRQGGTVISVDIDGVLTVETNGHDYKRRTPNREAVAYLADCTAKIILSSSRRESDRNDTTQWLAYHGVKYDALLLDKPPVDLTYDDIAMRSLC